ncbi:TRAP transporter small permease subunit [Pikeienuella piscinae]|uniref:TRAP transporter small permease protein n=1 Tax=Pikeienuella piscinae TaxID=2748098 RepID=A0A7M3T695_9RHOB|nr:TRAP transporter small permease subunit [Pikeienuella piscinae]QIE57526.1 TRAP transporter small permease subunit [Pikeienuella piscinae]
MALSANARKYLGWAELTAAIGLVGLVVLSVATLADALMRTFFESPIYGLSDLAEIVTPPVVASCLPAAIAARRNIAVRFLGAALPARGGQLVELFGQAAALLIFTGIAWQTGLHAADIVRNGQHTWLLSIPMGPTWILTEAILIACLPVQALIVIETWGHVRDGAPLAETQNDDDPELQV